MRAPIAKLKYQAHLYGTFRDGNVSYSPADDMGASPFPRYIQLQTINACQAACRMCPYPVYKDVFPRGRMDDALFDKIVAEIAQHPEVDTFVPMLQNEPMLDKRLFEKIAHFKQATGGRIRVELVTNGAFLTDDNIERIRESGLDLLDISLDALSRDVYRRIRIGLDYDAVLAGVERVIAARLPATEIFVRLVRQKENVQEVRAFTARWAARGVPVFIYDVHNRVGAVRDFESGVRVPDERVPLLRRLGRRVGRAWMRHCPIPFSSTNILHNGDMLMCVHDWGRKEVIGNVRDATIAELWNGERMRTIRRLVHARAYPALPACRDCSLWRDGYF